MSFPLACLYAASALGLATPAVADDATPAVADDATPGAAAAAAASPAPPVIAVPPPIVANPSVLAFPQRPAPIADRATEARALYRRGVNLQQAGIAVGALGVAGTAVGLLLMSATPRAETVCSPDYAAAFANDLANTLEGGGVDYGPSEPPLECHEELDHTAQIAGGAVTVLGVGLLTTGLVLALTGTARVRDATAQGFDPHTLEPFVTPVDGGALVGLTVRR